jgi:hypothetical protein
VPISPFIGTNLAPKPLQSWGDWGLEFKSRRLDQNPQCKQSPLSLSELPKAHPFANHLQICSLAIPGPRDNRASPTKLCDPANYRGEASAMVYRVLAIQRPHH